MKPHMLINQIAVEKNIDGLDKKHLVTGCDCLRGLSMH